MSPVSAPCITDSEKGSFHRQFVLCARKFIYRQGRKSPLRYRNMSIKTLFAAEL
jgi:hypothetical protein